MLGEERVGPCNLVEVASPFHYTTVESVRIPILHVLISWYMDFLNMLGKKRVGPCNFIEVASPFHFLTTLLKSQTSWSLLIS